ncbi:MAG TPA: hypothetical protein VJA18_03675 [Candidatus Nanoarchaeia archaeon]|nr:hypothetical protein [Candidatus Nanoarchaeia archaeon]
MRLKYNPEQGQNTFATNALVGILEETTALGIALKHGKWEEWQVRCSWGTDCVVGRAKKMRNTTK